MRWGKIDSPDIIDTTCEVVHDKEVKAVEANTTLLIHGGGPNNGVAFYDNSTTARALTTVGDTKFDSSQYKFRVSSIKFDGTGDYITALDSDDWDFGSGNFTIDTWIRFAALPANLTLMGLAGQYEIGPGTYWNWLVQNNAGTYQFVVGAHGITGLFPGSGVSVNIDSLVVNTWYHFAVVRNGNLMLFFKDGIQQGISQPFTGSITPIASVLAVGSLRVSDYTNGWLDEFRISKGIARWTSDFTPPTAPYDSSITQYVIDGLDGDTDEEYQLMIRQVSGYAANSGVLLRLNNDSGSNYGRQYLYAQDTTTVAGRAVTSYMLFNCSANLGEVGMAQINIYAKSGKVRTAIAKEVGNIATTTVLSIASVGYSWNNTVDNITSMTVINPSYPVFGTGSRIILLKKRQLTAGTKTGEIDPQGTTYGHWQLIHDYTLSTQTVAIEQTAYDRQDYALGDVGSSTEHRSGQSFVLSADSVVTAITLQQKNKVGTPTGNWTIRIETNAANLPSGTLVHANASVVVAPPGDATDVKGTFANSFNLVANTIYWIVVLCDNQANRDYWQLSNTKVGGYSYNAFQINGSWSDNGASPMYFKVHINGPLTSLIIPNLDGNKDVMYRIVARVIGGSVTGSSVYLRPNADSGANYGYQRLNGLSTTVDAGRGTDTGMALTLYYTVTQGYSQFSEALLYAKSGYVRTSIAEDANAMTGTSVSAVGIMGASWNNTADEITSLAIVATQTNGLGIGTHVELWRLNL